MPGFDVIPRAIACPIMNSAAPDLARLSTKKEFIEGVYQMNGRALLAALASLEPLRGGLEAIETREALLREAPR